jgi:soluble lytic murein transglycosylase-like protein
LLGALTWWESGGDKDAISEAGAVGLTQVMPKDGIAASFMCQNGPCFANRPTIEELKDPQFNLEFGGCYLSNLVSEHGLLVGLTRYSGGYPYAQYATPIIQIYENLKSTAP